MKTCLIYGHNGLDLDVTFNLLAFYRKAGLSVFYSDTLYDADVLVVLRAVDKKIDLSPFNFSVVHIFDYGGWDYNAFIESIDHGISYIYCTSQEKKNRIINDTSFPENRIFVAFPPVATRLWMADMKKPEYEIVHIGNYKPITENDQYKENFNKAIIDHNVHVWGLNWTGIVHKDLYHGKAGQFSVSGIYAKSAWSFGLMYPFQRSVTFSGRFWHAPLNGCQLFSEPGVCTFIPGVIETDYSFEDIEQRIKSPLADKQQVRQKALAFWNGENEKIEKLVKVTFSHFINDNNKTGKLKNYLSVYVKNKAVMLYHKMK
ncbi:MAG: hypothetical protein ABJB86_00945 [Bacteroidota bacterium]